MDTSDPDIRFDAAGICNHCHDAARKLEASVRRSAAGQSHMRERIEQIKHRNRQAPYDAVLGISGGVDSSYAAVVAHNIGLRLIAVHCDTGWNSEEAVHNVHEICNRLSIDLITHVIDWEVMRDLQAAFFRASVPNCDIPQDHAILAVNNRIAKEQGLKDFVSGGNFVGESILPIAWGHDARDLTHLKYIAKNFGSGLRKGYPTMGAFASYFWLPYVRGVRSYRILDDADYNPIEARKLLIRDYGWKDYGGKHHESVFTRFFQAYYLPEKFGFDKRKAHYSSLIAAGLMDRDEALDLIHAPLYSPERLRSDRDYFLKKLRIPEAEWDQIMTAAPRQHEEFPTNRFWHGLLTRLKTRIEATGIELRRSG